MQINMFEEVVVTREIPGTGLVERTRSVTVTSMQACDCPGCGGCTECCSSCEDCGDCPVCCRCMPGEG